jgi:hypothetical protein
MKETGWDMIVQFIDMITFLHEGQERGAVLTAIGMEMNEDVRRMEN